MLKGVASKIRVPRDKFGCQDPFGPGTPLFLGGGGGGYYVIVIDQLPRFVCSIEAQIPRAKPEG